MSFEQAYEYIGLNIMEKSNENDKYLIMIYKPNENKKEKIDILKIFKSREKFIFVEREYTGEIIRLFGKYFVKQNSNKCKIIYKNKKYKLKEYFDVLKIIIILIIKK